MHENTELEIHIHVYAHGAWLHMRNVGAVTNGLHSMHMRLHLHVVYIDRKQSKHVCDAYIPKHLI